MGAAWAIVSVEPDRPAPTAAQQNPEDAAKRQKDEADFQAAVMLARALRDSMNNPASFKLEQAARMEDGSLCFSYRATNAFNAIMPGHAVHSGTRFLATGQKGFETLWRQKCGGKAGVDITYIRRAM
jgi:uncharacterized protein (UPF0254 family)